MPWEKLYSLCLGKHNTTAKNYKSVFTWPATAEDIWTQHFISPQNCPNHQLEGWPQVRSYLCAAPQVYFRNGGEGRQALVVTLQRNTGILWNYNHWNIWNYSILRTENISEGQQAMFQSLDTGMQFIYLII